MRNKAVFLFILFLMLPVAASAQFVEGATFIDGVTPEEYRKATEGAEKSIIDRAEFLKIKDNAVIVDVRSKESFAYRHIQGSVNLPLTEMTEKTLPQLLPDKKKTVVLVCDNSFGPTRMLALSFQAYPVLKVNGYADVRQLVLWRESMQPQDWTGITLEKNNQ